MTATRRLRAKPGATVAAAVAVFAVVAGCQVTPSTSGGAPSPVIASQPIATQAATPSAAAVATSAAPSATPRPTPKPVPTSLPRPTDIPTDGTCEENHVCLGLLDTATHHTSVFVPGFSFAMPVAGWENIGESGGNVGFLPIDAPGDGIFFFRAPQATKPDGTVDISVPTELGAIKAWLTANTALSVSKPTDVTIGGLHGFSVDLGVPSGAATPSAGCPVATCVSIFRGRDPSSTPTWEWDFGVATSERERLYLLAAKDAVVAIFVDSLDGTTWDSLTPTADKFLKSVRFDGS